MKRSRRRLLDAAAAHAILGLFTLIALAPVALIVMNSVKSRRAIFGAPLALPGTSSFDLSGYASVLSDGHFGLYFFNSVVVTVAALAATILFGAMAAFALAEYRFRLNAPTALFLTVGIMVPIRLGTVGILEMMVATHLVNTRAALILVYTAQGLPMAVFILSEFMRTVSSDLKNASPGIVLAVAGVIVIGLTRFSYKVTPPAGK